VAIYAVERRHDAGRLKDYLGSKLKGKIDGYAIGFSRSCDYQRDKNIRGESGSYAAKL